MPALRPRISPAKLAETPPFRHSPAYASCTTFSMDADPASDSIPAMSAAPMMLEIPEVRARVSAVPLSPKLSQLFNR